MLHAGYYTDRIYFGFSWIDWNRICFSETRFTLLGKTNTLQCLIFVACGQDNLMCALNNIYLICSNNNKT